MRSLKRPSRNPTPDTGSGVSRAHRGLPQGTPRASSRRRWRWRPVPGQTGTTKAFNLAPVRWLIYAVGPIYPAPG